ncbi:hypothetical protein, partial [Neisseria canis]|uniref:hypothetical protein n=1 Tax=Neisseria canis TaxID=493 RepID=UPI001B80BC98
MYICHKGGKTGGVKKEKNPFARPKHNHQNPRNLYSAFGKKTSLQQKGGSAPRGMRPNHSGAGAEKTKPPQFL